MRGFAVVCLLALLIAGCMPEGPAASRGTWEAGYFAAFNMPEGAQHDALMARSNQQIDDVVQKLRAIQQNSLPPGCIHRTLNECLGSLSRILAIDDLYPGFKKYILGETDLDGHLIADRSVFFQGHIPGTSRDLALQSKPYLFNADVDPDLIVSKLEISLPADPLMATSAQDYYNTGAFEVVEAIKPAGCDLDRTEFYRNLDNNRKKKLTYSAAVGFPPRTQRRVDARIPSETVCGLQLQFGDAYGRDREVATTFSRRGLFGGGLLTIQ